MRLTKNTQINATPLLGGGTKINVSSMNYNNFYPLRGAT